MNIHKNARLTPHGREQIVAACVESGQSQRPRPRAVRRLRRRPSRKWVARYRAEGVAGSCATAPRGRIARQADAGRHVREVEALRRQRCTGKQIAAETRRLAGHRQPHPAGAWASTAEGPGAGRAGPPLRARASRRADPHRHQEARPLRARRPPHHRRSHRPGQQPRHRLGVRPCLHRRRLARRLLADPARREEGERRRLPQGRRRLLRKPRRHRRSAS